MKTTTLSIVLFSAASLWSACEDKEPRAMAPKVAQKAPAALAAAPEKAPETAFKPAPTEMLTATAPEPLKTISDSTGTHTADAAVVPTDNAKLAPALFEHQNESPNFDREIAAADVTVDRFVLAEGVKGREPVGESDTFSSDTKKIFAFVQLANGAEPYAVMVHFEPAEGPQSPYGVKLNVPTATRFRTWAWTAIERKPGRYRAVLRTLLGEEIASRELTITEATAD